MKTISIANRTLATATKLAARLGVSPSRLIARAVADFVARYDEPRVTERLNVVYAAHASSIGPALRRAQRNAIGENAKGRNG